MSSLEGTTPLQTNSSTLEERANAANIAEAFLLYVIRVRLLQSQWLLTADASSNFLSRLRASQSLN